jgi:hypothetical protein
MAFIFDANKEHRKRYYDPANYRDREAPSDRESLLPEGPERRWAPKRGRQIGGMGNEIKDVFGNVIVPAVLSPGEQSRARAASELPSQPSKPRPLTERTPSDILQSRGVSLAPQEKEALKSATPSSPGLLDDTLTSQKIKDAAQPQEFDTATEILRRAGVELTPEQKALLEKVTGRPGLTSDVTQANIRSAAAGSADPLQSDATYQAQLDRIWGESGKIAPRVTPEEEERWRERRAKKELARSKSKGSVTIQITPDSEPITVQASELDTHKGKALLQKIKDDVAAVGMERGTHKITLGGKSYDIPANFDKASVIEEAEGYRQTSVDSSLTSVLSYKKALEMALDTHRQVHGDNTVRPTITDENGQEVDLDGWLQQQRAGRAQSQADRTGKRVQVEEPGTQFDVKGPPGSNLYNTRLATFINPTFARKAPGSKKNDLTQEQYEQMQAELKDNQAKLMAAKGDKAAQAKVREERKEIGRKYQGIAKEQVAALSDKKDEPAPAAVAPVRESFGARRLRVAKERAKAAADKVTRANSVKMLSEGIRVAESELSDAKAELTRAQRHHDAFIASEGAAGKWPNEDETTTALRKEATAAVETAKARVARSKALVHKRRSRSNAIATTAAILPGGGYAGPKVSKVELDAIREAIASGDPDRLRDPWIADAYFRLAPEQRDEMRELSRTVKAKQGT